MAFAPNLKERKRKLGKHEKMGAKVSAPGSALRLWEPVFWGLLFIPEPNGLSFPNTGPSSFMTTGPQ